MVHNVFVQSRKKDIIILEDVSVCFYILQINLPESVCERYNHSVSAFLMGPYCVWLVVVGGRVKFGGADITDPNVMMLVELGK